MSGLSSAFDVGTKGYGGFVGRTTIMAIVGGTAAVIGGGKFANGAVSGAFVHMFNAEAMKFIRASLSGWKYGANGRYKTWLANGRDTGNSANAPFEYYNGRSPSDRFFNGVGGFIAQHPDGIGLALSLGAVAASGGASYFFGASALTLDVVSGDKYGAGIGFLALIKLKGFSSLDLAYGGCRANDTCSQFLDENLP